MLSYIIILYIYEGSSGSLYDLIRKGKQCTAVHRMQQSVISKYIAMDICSEVEWWNFLLDIMFVL